MDIRLIQEYNISQSVAKRLSKAYGGRAHDVLAIAGDISGGDKEAFGKLVLPGHPYLEAEVIFSVRYDWACHAEDFIARRTRLAFVNKAAALAAIPRVVDIMAKELNWDSNRKHDEIQRCIQFMRHMGGMTPLNNGTKVRMSTPDDIRDSFKKIDVKQAGFLKKEELRLVGEILNYSLSEQELDDCLDFAKLNGKISCDTFIAWWNSDRFNEGLVELKQNKTANLDQVEGSGTIFG